VGLLLTIISALALSIDLMLSVLLHIYEVYAQQNQTGTNVTLPQRIPSQQQNQTQDIGTASEIENLTTCNIYTILKLKIAREDRSMTKQLVRILI
jgi:hypothetical protein